MEGSASKTVSNQIKTGESVISAGKTHKQMLAQALFERQKTDDDKKMTKEEFERLIQWQIDEMAAVNAWLWSAELAYTSEQGDDAAVVDARDEAGAALDEALRIARNNVIQLGGRRALRAFGMASPPPGDMAGLAAYAKNVVELMRKNTTPITKAGMTFGPTAVADSVESLLTSYTGSLEADQTEKRELEDAKGVRDQAKVEWKVTYQSIAGQLEGLFRQAGRPDLADRVRPTTRRTRGDEPAEDVEDLDTPQPDAPQPEPVEPVVDEA